MTDHIGLTENGFTKKERHRGPAPSQFANTVFLDTEFTTLEVHRTPWLLSIGMVTQDGREFYVELDTSLDRSYRTRCTQWVRGHVLTQFRRFPGKTMSAIKMAEATAAWLEELGKEGPIEICYDYSWDFSFLESALEKAGNVTCHIEPTIIGYLLEDQDGIDASDASIKISEETDRIKEHHALADARALRARFEAVHGKPEPKNQK